LEFALSFLSSVIYWALTIYEWIVIIAILLSWVNPDPRNAIVVFLNNMTVPFWNWLRTRLPLQLRLFAPYISLLVIWFLKIFAPGSVRSLSTFVGGRLGLTPLAVQIAGHFLLAVGLVAQNFLYFLIILLLIWFFLTLVSPSVGNPIVRTVYFLVDPFITPVQKLLPRTRIDLSPLVVAAGFFLLSAFVVTTLLGYASDLANFNTLTEPAKTQY
jgi:YggT family protein